MLPACCRAHDCTPKFGLRLIAVNRASAGGAAFSIPGAEQALTGYLSNALKFAPEGRRILLRISREDDASFVWK
jgi:hypothetical protein